MFLRKKGFLLLIVLLGFLQSTNMLFTASPVSAASVSVSADCPASGKGRAAFLPPLTLGRHQSLVYSVSQYSTSGVVVAATLMRYDVTTKQTTKILLQSGREIVSPQVSADGQWILFSSVQYNQNNKTTTNSKVQLIRVDGKYLQTLYCATNEALGNVQWSTDQKQIALLRTSITSRATSVDLLNTNAGSLQTEFTSSDVKPVNLGTWLDTKRIYLTNIQTDSSPNTLYLLDTRKGANQHANDLATVYAGSSFSSFDSSYDGKKMYISVCQCGYGNTGPSTISVRPAAGGTAKTVHADAKYAITQVRAVSPAILLFTIFNVPFGGAKVDTSHNGLWALHTDGTGFTRLTKGNSGLNSNSQFPWSNVSRNGSLYAVQMFGSQESLLVGLLSGGRSITVASVPAAHVLLDEVGWTTM